MFCIVVIVNEIGKHVEFAYAPTCHLNHLVLKDLHSGGRYDAMLLVTQALWSLMSFFSNGMEMSQRHFFDLILFPLKSFVTYRDR